MASHEPRTTGTKVCSRCHVEKHVLAFAANKDNVDGLHGHCRDCEPPSTVERKERGRRYVAERRREVGLSEKERRFLLRKWR